MKIIKQVQVFRILVLALVLLAAAGAWAAGPWYVATNGADSNAGTSWSVPYLTISNALTNASIGGDTIWVSNGVYTLTAMVSNPADKKFNICAWSTNPANTVLLGPGSNNTVNFRGVWMSGPGSLQGFTVTNFYLTNENFGAGVYCSAGLVSNCVIAGNIMGYAVGYPNNPAYGFGVYLSGGGVVENCDIIGNWNYPGIYDSGGSGIMMSGSARIRNCRIVGNRLTGSPIYGAGVYAWHGSDFVIQDSVIASNSGGASGGGISMTGGIVSNCQVFANSSASGGGICFYAPAGWGYYNYARLERCVISNNVGSYNGGCYITGIITNVLISRCAIVSNYCDARANGGLCVTYGVSNVWIRNCLVAYNRGAMGWGESGLGGCGIYMAAVNALLENCTIVSNSLSSGGSPQGAGLFATNGVRVVNSIIYHNVGVTTSNIYAFADCTFSNSCTAPTNGLTGTANTDANPRFVAKDTGNFRLNNNSPCLNTGMNEVWMTNTVDFEGRKRIRYGIVDMGAYERIHSGTTYGFR